jgi:hypothetical protein
VPMTLAAPFGEQGKTSHTALPGRKTNVRVILIHACGRRFPLGHQSDGSTRLRPLEDVGLPRLAVFRARLIVARESLLFGLFLVAPYVSRAATTISDRSERLDPSAQLLDLESRHRSPPTYRCSQR